MSKKKPKNLPFLCSIDLDLPESDLLLKSMDDFEARSVSSSAPFFLISSAYAKENKEKVQKFFFAHPGFGLGVLRSLEDPKYLKSYLYCSLDAMIEDAKKFQSISQKKLSAVAVGFGEESLFLCTLPLRHLSYRDFEDFENLPKSDVFIVNTDSEEMAAGLFQKIKSSFPDSLLIAVSDHLSEVQVSEILDLGVHFVLESFVFQKEMIRILDFYAEFSGIKRELRSKEKKIQELSILDPGSGLYNTDFMLETLSNEFNRHLRYESPLSIAIVDVDFLSEINETFGREKGNEVLHDVAKVITATIRKTDYAGRFESAAYILIFPETPVPEVRLVVERICSEVEEAYWKKGNLIITLSAGVTSIRNGDENVDDLLGRVHHLLTDAKLQGKNRIEVG